MAKHYLQLSKILQKLLYDRRMNVSQLAHQIELPVPTVHRLVTGKSTRPYRSSLKPIADFFSLNVDQLIGEEPLPELYFKELDHPHYSHLPAQAIKTIPLLAWADTENPQAKQNAKRHIVTTGNVSNEAFALMMLDYSMEPVFPRSTVLIFDPKKQPADRSYVLVKLDGKENPIFRQLLIDIDHQYLKPLNPDSNVYKMRILGQNDMVLACLFESRMSHEPDDTSSLVLEGVQ